LVFTYAQKAISEEQIDDAVIIVLLNDETYAGTCHIYHPTSNFNDYGKGASISYFPLGTDEEMFEGTLHHEAGGHGFAKLADEYYGWSDKNNVPNDIIEEIQLLSTYGWVKNIDLTNNISTVKWSKFLSDARYSNEDIGIFEGGYDYNYGVYRPSYNGIMNTELYKGFNAPSREAIYYRIHKLAYGDDWEYDYEKFVEYDAINRNPVTSRSITFQQMAPLHAPVIIKGSWKDAKYIVSSQSNSRTSNNLSSKKDNPSMVSMFSYKTTLPDGTVLVKTFDTSGKTTIENEKTK
jgi:hypothetical protein